jgi:hypothetical protein
MSDDSSAGGKLTAVQVRMRQPLLEAIENWRRAQPTIPSRSMALRELLERGLEQQDAVSA